MALLPQRALVGSVHGRSCSALPACLKTHAPPSGCRRSVSVRAAAAVEIPGQYSKVRGEARSPGIGLGVLQPSRDFNTAGGQSCLQQELKGQGSGGKALSRTTVACCWLLTVDMRAWRRLTDSYPVLCTTL